MSEPRVLTVEEANALVPRLSDLVRRQMTQAKEIEALLEKLRDAVGDERTAPPKKPTREPSHAKPARPTEESTSSTLEIDPNDSAEVRTIKVELLDLVRAYEDGWREVQELGAVVKDARAGLCDFYGRVDGKLVWLCWRYGEASVDYYHDLNTGFSARKRLDKALRQRMLN